MGKVETKQRYLAAKLKMQMDLNCKYDPEVDPKKGITQTQTRRKTKAVKEQYAMHNNPPKKTIRKKNNVGKSWTTDAEVNKAAKAIYLSADKSMKVHTGNVRGISTEMAAVKGV